MTVPAFRRPRESVDPPPFPRRASKHHGAADTGRLVATRFARGRANEKPRNRGTRASARACVCVSVCVYLCVCVARNRERVFRRETFVARREVARCVAGRVPIHHHHRRRERCAIVRLPPRRRETPERRLFHALFGNPPPPRKTNVCVLPRPSTRENHRSYQPMYGTSTTRARDRKSVV